MNRRFVAYVDTHKNKITSLVLAEFDADELSQDDKEMLEDWESGDFTYDEEILDSIKPYHYYYAIDFNDTSPFILIDGKDPSNETWPAQCDNIYKKLHKAELALKMQLVNNNINRGIIKKIL